MINQGVLTPRSRQELEPQKLMRTRRPVLVTPLIVAVRPVVVAMPTADYVFEALWGANVTGADAQYNIYIVTGNEAPSAANAIAVGVVMPSNTTDIIVGGSGMMLAPGQAMIASCSAANAINLFGHGWDIMGDYQT